MILLNTRAFELMTWCLKRSLDTSIYEDCLFIPTNVQIRSDSRQVLLKKVRTLLFDVSTSHK